MGRLRDPLSSPERPTTLSVMKILQPRRRRVGSVSAAEEPSPDLAPLDPYSSDVADVEALRSFLMDTDIFGPATDEAAAYLADAFERFRVTMSLLPLLAGDVRVLELGANPYFVTRMLRRRGYDVTCANWFGAASGFGRRAQQISRRADGREDVFDFDHFNVEADRFPYDSDEFDVVLCCEILEHLPVDPSHMLAEIHRVTKPGGVVLLTTPNAIRTDNVARIIRGDNVYEELSGYGAYGRHNREYTVTELRTLLEDCGYRIESVKAQDVHGTPPPLPAMANYSTLDRGDNLFAVARPEGEARWRYPRWLYSSRHALARVVRPDVIVGVNEELQASGLHPAERDLFGRPGAWTDGRSDASFTLCSPHGGSAIELLLTTPPSEVGRSLNVSLQAKGRAVAVSLEPAGDDRIVRLDVPCGSEEVVTVTLTVEPDWSPSEVGLGADPRRLGVVVRWCRIESAD
jgi:SAM-dependent methyltransferase